MVKILTILISTVSNSQVFLLKKCKSFSHFFSKNISVYAIFDYQNFNDKLTNDIFSFEQPGPGVFIHQKGWFFFSHSIKWKSIFWVFGVNFACRNADFPSVDLVRKHLSSHSSPANVVVTSTIWVSEHKLYIYKWAESSKKVPSNMLRFRSSWACISSRPLLSIHTFCSIQWFC